MTSVVDTSVKLAWSGMANAPVLNGQAGSLLGVLDAALVTGFDIKPLASLTVANGIASATFAGQHSAQLDSVILIEGVTGALAHLNGEQKVTARPAANTLTFASACADGAATGAITMKMAPAGWARPYSGANKAAYTSADPQSLGMWLRVDDSTRNVRVIGYESMSDVDTGNGPFPSASMIAGGGYWNKSSQASAAAVPWVLAADSRLLLLWMVAGLPSSTTATGGCVVAFGDPISYKSGGDAYATGPEHLMDQLGGTGAPKQIRIKRPLLRYFGGKWAIAPWVLAYLPPHRLYVEPFGGAASILLRKPRSRIEVYNDLDEEIVGILRTVQDPASCRALIRRLRRTLYARREFELAFEHSRDPVIRAQRAITRTYPSELYDRTLHDWQRMTRSITPPAAASPAPRCCGSARKPPDCCACPDIRCHWRNSFAPAASSKPPIYRAKSTKFIVPRFSKSFSANQCERSSRLNWSPSLRSSSNHEANN